MLNFKPITKDAVQMLMPYLIGNSVRFCDFSPANLYIWAGYFYKAYALERDMLYLQLYTDDGDTAYAVPIGKGDVKAALQTLRCHTDACGEPLVLSLVSDQDLPLLRETFPSIGEPQSERQWCDYLYDAVAMASFAGSAYAKQRNHVRKFEKQYPDYRVETLTPACVPSLEAFLDRFPEQRGKEDVFAMEEVTRTKEALRHMETLGLFGVVLYVGETLVGFSAGSRLQDVLFVNFEKADTRYSGVYQMLVKAFASRYVTDGVGWINREEDCGDEGLRKSKLAYHPVALLEKYTVEVGK